jgi:hypothetical protein
MTNAEVPDGSLPEIHAATGMVKAILGCIYLDHI